MTVFENIRRQQGFSLVAVIFLVTVLALGVVFIQRISNVSVATTTLAMQGARAWQAAQAGAEWGIYNVINGGCPAASSSFSLSEQSLSGFNITVNCTTRDYTEVGTTVTMYYLDVLAESGSLGTSPNYVSRKITLTVEN
jgi:MSHA biogenesis protein MshP